MTQTQISSWGDGDQGSTEPTQSALGALSFAAEFDIGRRLSSFEAFTEAMSVTIPKRSGESRANSLTRRESEVLAHLSLGKTNQEIAADLFVGKSTVDTHVSHILAKLGVESRRDAVKVARQRGMLGSIGSDASALGER